MAAEVATEQRNRCTPCRGTGQVISTLGGSPHTVTCPWCEGTGSYMPGHDAQQDKRGGES
jgi:DnaJ-class molecular chaperone